MFSVFVNTALSSRAGLHCWEDIDKLNSFPKLEEVKLLGIPLLQSYTTEERRKLLIARSVGLFCSEKT